MTESINRRTFLATTVVALTGGCLSNSSADSTPTVGETDVSETDSSLGSTDTSDAVEKGGFELAYTELEASESYNGISATVYNNNPERRTVTVRFIAYDNRGNKIHEGTDSVTVDPYEQAPVSLYWEQDTDSIQGADVRIMSVE